MNNETARVMGGIYIAICSALSPEGVEMANDVLFGFANNPEVRPEDRRIYGLIAEAAGRPIEELRAEVEQYERQSSFEVITGGMPRFAIVSSTGCAGFILCRRHEFQAYDAEEKSLGLFPSEEAAVEAVTKNITTTDSIETSI